MAFPGDPRALEQWLLERRKAEVPEDYAPVAEVQGGLLAEARKVKDDRYTTNMDPELVRRFLNARRNGRIQDTLGEFKAGMREAANSINADIGLRTPVRERPSREAANLQALGMELDEEARRRGEAATAQREATRRAELEQGERRLSLQEQGEARQSKQGDRRLDLTERGLTQSAEEFARKLGLDFARLSQDRQQFIQRLLADEGKRLSSTEEGLRKEFNALGPVKSFQEASIAFDKVKSAANDPSAAGDLALIFGFMKTLDPGSTVREGEFANAQNAGGIPDRLQAQYNRIISGERLTQAQRADFVRAAATQFEAQERAYRTYQDYYSGLATESGVAPGRVTPQSSPPRTPAAQAPPKDSSGQPTLDPPPAGKVRVRINGKVGLIPREKLEEARKRGAEEVR